MLTENYYIKEPKPYQEIGAGFVVSGWVPQSWLFRNDGYQDNRIFTELIGIDCKIFGGDEIKVKRRRKQKLSTKEKTRYYFSEIIQLNYFNVSFIESSQGRITLKLHGQNEDTQRIFIPLMVKQFEPKEGASEEIIKKHGKVGEIITQFRKDLKNYNNEMGMIMESREMKGKIFDDEKLNKYSYANDWEIVGGIYNILNEEEDSREEYLYSEEDKKQEELENKYKDAIAWRGQLYKILVGRMNGFEFRIYSNDHDKHFHVIHKGRKINARFSFPKIELMNYKNSKNTINSKEEDKIRDFFKHTKNYKKLTKEFQRRDAC